MNLGEPLGNSDHKVIKFDLKLNTNVKEIKSIGASFREGDFEGLRVHISIENWEGVTKIQVTGQR